MNKIKMIMTLALAMFSIMGVKAQETTGNEEVVFYESFDKMAGKGGNDGNWDVTAQPVRYEAFVIPIFEISNTDNSNWVIGKAAGFNTAVANASKCVIIGTTANLSTPKLKNLSGDAILTFKAGAAQGNDVTLTLSINGGGELDTKEIKLQKNQFDTYTVKITNGTANTTINFAQTTIGLNLFLDEVKIVKPSTPTAISNIKGEAQAEAVKVYNLQGEQVATSTKNLKAGVYVANGKKFVVK